MRLDRTIKLQLAVLAVVALISTAVMAVGYMKLPVLLFDVGRYSVTVQLPEAAGLYKTGNVTYRGTQVGRVTDVRLTDNGVEAVLSLKSEIDIPSDVQVQIHSVSAVGEQYVALLPRSANARPLKDGDVISRADTSTPPAINTLLDATNNGLQAIPQDNLKTAIDEAYTAVGGLGPEIKRAVEGSTGLAIDARKNLDPLTALVDQSAPVLDSQTNAADAIHAWAAHLATVTGQLQQHDRDLGKLLTKGASAADEARQLIQRVQPTLPLLLANLASIAPVAITYQPALEQLLVLIPQGVANLQGTSVANLNTKQDLKGGFLDFNLNINLPPPCNTGFLPAQQQRNPTFQDYPDRPAGDLYCRVPQDGRFNVRGARNLPCLSVPGKRAPTVAMCESDENYVPLNDGYNWKGDPNATLTGQGIPQLAPGTAPIPPPPAPSATDPNSSETTPGGPAPQPIAVARYDPTTGTYVGPDGRIYTQSDLSAATGEQSWQDMLMPSKGN